MNGRRGKNKKEEHEQDSELKRGGSGDEENIITLVAIKNVKGEGRRDDKTRNEVNRKGYRRRK